MNVFVTGGSGTIGGYVLRDLGKAGHSVSCYSRTAPRVAGVRFIQGDIMDLDRLNGACPGYDAIIHLAAVPGPGRATPEQLLHVNVIGTVHVLEAAIRAGVRKVVFASSGAATGFSFQRHRLVPRYLPLDEEHPCEPQDEYGLSKLLAELACKRYSDAYGIQTVCLRINHNWYLNRGEAWVAIRSGWAKSFATVEDLWSERYLKTIRDPDGIGEWAVPGPPTPPSILWAFTDARDAAQAFRLAVENDEIVHEVFLINGDETCSDVETPELLSRHFSSVPLTAALNGHASLWSHEKATRMLGYQPRYAWRETDFGAWLADSST